MKKSLFLIPLFAYCSFSAQMATVDSKKLFAAIPEMAKIDTLVTKEQNKYAEEYQKKRTTVIRLSKTADSLYQLKPKEETTKKTIEKAQTANKELQDYEMMANKKIAEYKDLLYKPYLEKINSAVKLVATRRKYMQVIDIMQVPFAYISTDADITNDVVKELKK